MYLATLKNSFEQWIKEKPLILVVDDDEDNLLLISHVLVWHDYKFVTAKSRDEAFVLARRCLPDLILLDIVLPNKHDGIELINTLKQDKLMKKIPIIAVTGLTFPEDREEIARVGGDDYLGKPYLLDDLEAIICRHLQP